MTPKQQAAPGMLEHTHHLLYNKALLRFREQLTYSSVLQGNAVMLGTEGIERDKIWEYLNCAQLI